MNDQETVETMCGLFGVAEEVAKRIGVHSRDKEDILMIALCLILIEFLEKQKNIP